MSSDKSNKLTWRVKLCYGVGHVFNDLCSAMWFSYLLIFFENVLLFDSTQAGLLLLIGQLTDGICTPLVGMLSDRKSPIACCAKYGRRKIWHLIGSILVASSFTFIFSPCFNCSYKSTAYQVFYYSMFICAFQIGWACVQISHLALIPDLAANKHQRTELTSIRYAFTVLSSLSVYALTFVFLRQDSYCCETTESALEGDLTTEYSSPANCSLTVTSNNTASSCALGPSDAQDFRNVALICTVIGVLFSAVFHIGVPEANTDESNLEIIEKSSKKVMRKRDWFKELPLYQVYIPLYVSDTLQLEKSAVASVPFVMYFAGFLGSLVMKLVNKKLGRKVTYSSGCIIGILACIWIEFGDTSFYITVGVYLAAALLGTAGSTVLITSISVTADYIGENTEGSAFIYGFMSFVDKLSNGFIIMAIQELDSGSPSYYQQVLVFSCGSACVVGFITALTLIGTRLGLRKGQDLSGYDNPVDVKSSYSSDIQKTKPDAKEFEL